ncbi:MAG: Pyrroline-5-carboxylate reductase [Actinobacteria bacterium]|nr:Pyrroline-5-carboxylate reductase [Actinomycetota bacterium]
MKKTPKRLAIIGAGKVGTAIGHILQKKDFNIVAVASRTQESLDCARDFIFGFKTRDVAEAAKLADVIILTTNDDQVEPACRKIAQNGGFDAQDVVFHVSGALSLNVLDSAKAIGAKVGSIHPLQSFATVGGAVSQLPGSVFGVTAEKEVLTLARDIVEALGGTAIVVKDEDKPLYHAAACVASNYFVGLIHFAQSIYESLGVSKEVALKALLPLIKGTLANMESQGTAGALTGPIARGDVEPVKRHLEAFGSKIPEKKKLYCELGKHTTLVALEKGTISKDKQKELYQLLQGGGLE